MSLLGRGSFVRDLVVLLIVGVVLACLVATGLAMTTDKYFARAVTGVLGDYGQYDLLFQTRSELRDATVQQLQSVINNSFPGSNLHLGVTIAGKSTIFLRFSKAYRTREVFESLYSYFGNLPGNASFSIVSEPRIVLSAVPSGAQDLLDKEISQLAGVSFIFNDNDLVNIMLRSANNLDLVQAQIKRIINRYRLFEIRFPIDNPVSDLGTLGKQLEAAVGKVSGVQFCQDVTRGGSTSDTQYMAAALSEMRRFMASYAARVTLHPSEKTKLISGDLLVLQGRADRAPTPGEDMNDAFVEVKLDSVNDKTCAGMIIQGDASYIKEPAAYQLMPGNKVGKYVGTVTVTDERAALMAALDDGIALLQNVQNVVADPSWDATGSFQDYQNIVNQISSVSDLLAAIKSGSEAITAKDTRARLQTMADQIDGISGDLNRLSETLTRIQLVENKVGTVIDRIQAFQFILQSAAGGGGPAGSAGAGQRLIEANQALSTLSENLRNRARQIDDFINRFNPLVQVLSGWGERARVLSEQLNYFGDVLTPGTKAYAALESLSKATDTTLKQLQGFNTLNLFQELSKANDSQSSAGKIDLNSIIEQMQYVRNSLPQLLDEEIGRSIEMIDSYLGGDVIPGSRIQILTNAGVNVSAVSATMQRVSGRSETSVLNLPVGAIEPDLNGEIYKVLGEVRTTITALVLFALFVLEFLLDQTAVIAMLRRQAEAVSRRVVGPRPRLARFTSFVLNPARIYAVGYGAFWLWICFTLTGASLPMLGQWGAAVLGGTLGLLLGHLAERINPIDNDEVMAGESLGLPFVLIMREIVIPAGRPGLLQVLNRHRMKMRGGRVNDAASGESA